MQLEVFTDWRRTGIPALQPTNTECYKECFIPEAIHILFPKDFKIGASMAAGVKITDHVWWDVSSKK